MDNVIKKIELVNFRSHAEFSLEFHKQTTMIAGENGCGKTSILEAIFEGCQGKSFKAVDKEIVKNGTEYYRVGLFYVSGEKTIVRYDAKRNKKEFEVVDKVAGRLPKKNKYPIVIFEPNDLNLVGASPAHKRGYFDRLIAQMSETYSSSLSKFNKALKQRNELLKEEYLRADALFSWNVMLSKYGSYITKMRREMVRRLNEKITETYRAIAENEDEVEIQVKTEVTDESEYLANLEKCFEKDKILGHTTFGTEKDDFAFMFNGKEADGVASRGEIRSMVIAMKFLEAEMLYSALNKKPVILLDDVFSELDDKRQRALAQNFKKNQVIITSVKGVD